MNIKIIEQFEEEWKFIWGIKANDDTSDSDANMYTLNDFNVWYNKKTNKYTMSIETIYEFEEGKKGQQLFVLEIFKKFTKWMKDNNYSTKHEISMYELFTKGKNMNSDYNSLGELYGYFKCFVTGFCGEMIV